MPSAPRPIVIVDDDADDAFFTQRQMNKVGILNPVVVCTGGNEALRYLRRLCQEQTRTEDLPCVVFLDVKMPGLGGHDVLAWARRQPQLNEVKFVMLSTSDDPRDLNRARELGADKYLIKHPPAEHLRDLVQEVSCIKAA
jgi:two-component system response regulator